MNQAARNQCEPGMSAELAFSVMSNTGVSFTTMMWTTPCSCGSSSVRLGLGQVCLSHPVCFPFLSEEKIKYS